MVKQRTRSSALQTRPGRVQNLALYSDRPFSDLFFGSPVGAWWPWSGRPGMVRLTHAWAPSADIVREPGAFVLRIDLPGVPSDKLTLEVGDGLLTVSGRRPEAVSNAGQIVSERFAGEFVRRFRLPSASKVDRITARYADGVLEVVVPLVAQVTPQRIPVKGA